MFKAPSFEVVVQDLLLIQNKALINVHIDKMQNLYVHINKMQILMYTLIKCRIFKCTL